MFFGRMTGGGGVRMGLETGRLHDFEIVDTLWWAGVTIIFLWHHVYVYICCVCVGSGKVPV